MIKAIKNKQSVFLLWEIATVLLFYLILGMKWLSKYTKLQIFIFAILGLLVSLIFHELVHYLFMRFFSKEKVTVGFVKRGVLVRYIYLKLHDKLNRWQLIIVKVAPAVVLTVIPTLVMLFTGYRSMFMYSFVMLNFAASYYDLIETISLWRKIES